MDEQEQAYWLNRLRRDPAYMGSFLDEFIQRVRRDPQGVLLPQWDDLFQEPRFRRALERRAPAGVIEELLNRIDRSPRFDSEVDEVDVLGQNVVFLIGAGASVASGIPAVADLLPELWTRARRLGRSDLQLLEQWCKEHGIDNIEDMLTASYISEYATSRSHMYDLLRLFLFSRNLREEEKIPQVIQDPASIRFLQETFRTLFGLLTSKMLKATPNAGHEAVARFVSEHQDASIITTNYDACIDEALDREGVTFATFLKSPPGEKAVPLVKMHGSVNWAYCESCHREKEYDLAKMKELIDADQAGFSLASICPKCDGIRRPLLVPPLSFKLVEFPALVDIWWNAKRSLEAASLIIAVGYSFADADTYLTRIVWQSLAKHPQQKLLIVNPDRALVASIRDKLESRLGQFDKSRVIHANGKAEEALPMLVDKLLLQAGHKATSQAMPTPSVVNGEGTR